MKKVFQSILSLPVGIMMSGRFALIGTVIGFVIGFIAGALIF